MARLSLARRKLKLKKVEIAMQWWLNILHLVGLFIQLSYKLFERQCMGGSTHNMDAFREATMITGNKIVKATEKFSQVIGVDLDIANKRDKINKELRKLLNLSRAERYKALIAIGHDQEMTALFFTLENDEREDFVKALLSGGL